MKKTHVVVHHSLTPDGRAVDWQGFRQFHTSWRIGDKMVSEAEGRAAQAAGAQVEPPWRDIGYHWGLEEINGQLEILAGRPDDDDGAHCPDANMNRVGIGFCVCGDYDTEVISSGKWNKALAFTRWLMRVHGIPRENVIGHREAQALGGRPPEKRKTCPGKTFNMDAFRAAL
jgi:N-acetylmuramoyl-L-alanine amidase